MADMSRHVWMQKCADQSQVGTSFSAYLDQSNQCKMHYQCVSYTLPTKIAVVTKKRLNLFLRNIIKLACNVMNLEQLL